MLNIACIGVGGKGDTQQAAHFGKIVAVCDIDERRGGENFEYASTLTESMLLGNVAVRSGEVIDYEPATGRITNSSTASQYLKPYFRKGWEV